MLVHYIGKQAFLRDSEITNVPRSRLDSESDFAAPIEQNRRRSRATLRILRLRSSEIWPEAGMRDGILVFAESLRVHL